VEEPAEPVVPDVPVWPVGRDELDVVALVEPVPVAPVDPVDPEVPVCAWSIAAPKVTAKATAPAIFSFSFMVHLLEMKRVSIRTGVRQPSAGRFER
jgi:hypothetical protein